MSLPLPVSLALETAINAIVRLDPETQESLSAIDGKTIQIHVQQPTVSVLLGVVDGRIQIINHSEQAADTTISGTPQALTSLSDANDALYRGDVIIDGDLAVAQQLKDILAKFDPDWQEAISPLFGDTVTHRLDRAQQQFAQWFKRTRQSTRMNTSDYLQEESELLAPNSEILRFCHGVDELRAAADRLEARLAHLEKHHHQDPDGHDPC